MPYMANRPVGPGNTVVTRFIHQQAEWDANEITPLCLHREGLIQQNMRVNIVKRSFNLCFCNRNRITCPVFPSPHWK